MVHELKRRVDTWATTAVLQRIRMQLPDGSPVPKPCEKWIGDADNTHTELARTLGYIDDALNWIELGMPSSPNLHPELAGFHASPLHRWMQLFMNPVMNGAARVEVILYITTRYLPSPAWRQAARSGDPRKKHASYIHQDNREYLTDLVLFLLEFGVSEHDLAQQEPAIYGSGVMNGEQLWSPLYDPQVYERLDDFFREARRPPTHPDDPGGAVYRREIQEYEMERLAALRSRSAHR